eukprot:1023190-Amphidinium_carterae.1
MIHHCGKCGTLLRSSGSCKAWGLKSWGIKAMQICKFAALDSRLEPNRMQTSYIFGAMLYAQSRRYDFKQVTHEAMGGEQGDGFLRCGPSVQKTGFAEAGLVLDDFDELVVDNFNFFNLAEDEQVLQLQDC